MKKIILFLIALVSVLCRVSGQDAAKIVYVVDSVPVIDDPAEGEGELNPSTISEMMVIKNKDSLKAAGYGDQDEVVYIFTKLYRSRSEAIRGIPTTKRMIRKDGRWYLQHDTTPYSGPFIDYYYNGTKKGDGYFERGLLNGDRVMYTYAGVIQTERNYDNGVPNGREKEYYPNGVLKQMGDFKNGKEEGIWEKYFPNGQVKEHVNMVGGIPVGEALTYYSNGKVKFRNQIKDGKVLSDPDMEKVSKLYDKGAAAAKEEDYKTAIKYYSKCIELDSTYASAWFGRGTAKLDNFQFDDALSDFDKAVALEPYFVEALGNRAFCRIRKNQFGHSRTLTKNSEVTVLAAPDKIPLAAGEKEKICFDLQEAVFLGDDSPTIKDALKEYCKGK
jgi:antitoxin component YwqK of YwqJK toxin-antitoxin module